MKKHDPDLRRAQLLPSVDDVKPGEEGGPIARSGFNYQDEIAAGFLIEMLEDPSFLKMHCETHDDVVLVRTVDGSAMGRRAEFVQVKANEPDKLWSISDLGAGKKTKTGAPIFEVSLGRDKHSEESRFRIVTLRPVVSNLKILTFSYGAPGREAAGHRFKTLKSELDRRFPDVKSRKRNGTAYWIENCYWDVRHSWPNVRDANLLRIMRLSSKEERPLLPELAEVLVEELRARAKEAGDAKWEPDRDKKIITRRTLRVWWERRAAELIGGAVPPSGRNLRTKMVKAGLPDEVIGLAVDMRREYARVARTSHYMEPEEVVRLQSRVKSEVMSLRARFVSGQSGLDGVGFHALCVERMDTVNGERSAGSQDRSAFLKGCMYDIADRCLLRFSRPEQ